MRAMLVSSLSVVFWLVAASCLAQSIDDLQHIISNNICPSPLAKYKTVTPNEHCGENYMDNMSTRDALRCQSETERLNNVIYAYNDHIRKCAQLGRNSNNKESSTQGNGSSNGSVSRSSATDLDALLRKSKQKAAAAADANDESDAQFNEIKKHAESVIEQRAPQYDPSAEDEAAKTRELERQVRQNTARERAKIPAQESVFPKVSRACQLCLAGKGTCGAEGSIMGSGAVATQADVAECCKGDCSQ